VSHAGFLRDEGMAEANVIELVTALRSAAPIGARSPPEDAVSMVEDAVAGAPGLQPTEGEILTHVARATLAPQTLRARHLDPLRRAGLDDLAIHDVVHVEACFAYMNRLADSLGVCVFGEERRIWAVRLLGEEALRDHDRWASGT
jgi:alkylhydroperoxidase family enzyme